MTIDRAKLKALVRGGFSTRQAEAALTNLGAASVASIVTPVLLATDFEGGGNDIYATTVTVEAGVYWPGSLYVGAVGAYKLLSKSGPITAAWVYNDAHVYGGEVLAGGEYILAYFCDTGSPAPAPLGWRPAELPLLDVTTAGKFLSNDGTNKFWVDTEDHAWRRIVLDLPGSENARALDSLTPAIIDRGQVVTFACPILADQVIMVAADASEDGAPFSFAEFIVTKVADAAGAPCARISWTRDIGSGGTTTSIVFDAGSGDAGFADSGGAGIHVTDAGTYLMSVEFDWTLPA